MPVFTRRTFQVGCLVQGKVKQPGNSQPVPASVSPSVQWCSRLLEDSPGPGTLQARRSGQLSRSGRSVCPLPAKEHSSAIRESIFQLQKSTLHSPQSLQEATWERRGVLESHMLPGKEEEVPGRQSLQGGLGGAGLSLPRKEERRSPN